MQSLPLHFNGPLTFTDRPNEYLSGVSQTGYCDGYSGSSDPISPAVRGNIIGLGDERAVERGGQVLFGIWVSDNSPGRGKCPHESGSMIGGITVLKN
jgi:hypothetical protein